MRGERLFFSLRAGNALEPMGSSALVAVNQIKSSSKESFTQAFKNMKQSTLSAFKRRKSNKVGVSDSAIPLELRQFQFCG